MGAQKIFEATWFSFCVILASNIVSHKIEKNYQYSMCFKNFVVFWGYMGDPRGKMWSTDTVPEATGDQMTWCVLVPKVTWSMGDMDLPSYAI